MIAAAIILAILIVGGGLLYIHDRLTRPDADAPAGTADIGAPNDATGDSAAPGVPVASAARTTENSVAASADDSVCCGMHLTCEKDTLSTALSDEIIYYDDEELDIFAARPGDDYTPAETDQFRDIMLTLLPSDIAGWARSLQLRRIPLPPEIRDELLLIVSESRPNQ